MLNKRFFLSKNTIVELKSLKPRFGFGLFGEATFYRTYSRLKADGSQEHWVDTVIRVVEGILSIRKNHYIQNGLKWDETFWQNFAQDFAITFFHMHWLPPGRGLWMMGTEYMYERGSAALYNCGAVDTSDLVLAADWTVDMLMCGVGVGFNMAWDGKAKKPDKSRKKVYKIEDSKEGWVKSTRFLLESYIKGKEFYIFDYSLIRPAGSPIKGFGGTASGPEPLKLLHKRLEQYLDDYCDGKTDKTRCIADVFNAIGACVVAGNVRRSAEIALGSVHDEIFLNLKDYEKYPERAEIGWMSNNTVMLEKTEDFHKLPEIAKHMRKNGEPGICNLINIRKYGRFGKEMKDLAWLTNPCSEIPLEGFELCNLAEVFPTRCKDETEFYQSLKYATFYASTVSLLPTHRTESNAIIARNRRIGVSLSGVADLLEIIGATELTRRLRKGYEVVRYANKAWAAEAGIPESLRVTTIKPSGTISQLAGTSSGMHFPTSRYAIRRMRVGNFSPIYKFLKDAGIPHEPDKYSFNTTIFEFPISYKKTRKAASVSPWEQFALLAMLQREWSDNMVSATITFDPKTEGPQIERMLAQFAPIIKSVSMLPLIKEGAYEQMPYEAITKKEYEKMIKELPQKIDWSKLEGSVGAGEGYCSLLECEL